MANHFKKYYIDSLNLGEQTVSTRQLLINELEKDIHKITTKKYTNFIKEVTEENSFTITLNRNSFISAIEDIANPPFDWDHLDIWIIEFLLKTVVKFNIREIRISSYEYYPVSGMLKEITSKNQYIIKLLEEHKSNIIGGIFKYQGSGYRTPMIFNSNNDELILIKEISIKT